MGLHLKTILRLKLMQNALAHIWNRAFFWDHMPPVLWDLPRTAYWFNMLVMIYQVLNGVEPPYVWDHLSPQAILPRVQSAEALDLGYPHYRIEGWLAQGHFCEGSRTLELVRPLG